jgi:hypothetical protein
MSETCMICLDTQRVSVKYLPSCSCRIAAHESCLSTWSNTHPNECPLCRRKSSPALNIRVNVQTQPIIVNRPGRFEKIGYAICIIIASVGIMLLMLAL